MKATKAIASVLVALLFPHIALAESWLTLDPTQYPDEVRQSLDQSRSGCKEAGAEVVEYAQAGVTIVDLNRDGSKDIILEPWRACSVQVKGFGGCNTAGCELKVFKQVGGRQWKLILDETVGSDWFLSSSQRGHVRLLAVSISRKLSDRCPDPDGSVCDYLLSWKRGRWVWDRIRSAPTAHP